MNLALVFRISGVILVINGISMFVMPSMAAGMYGFEGTPDLIVVIHGLGLSFIATGVLVLMLPGWIESKLASAGMLLGVIQLAWFLQLGFDLWRDRISGDLPSIINLILTGVLAIMFFVMSSRESK